MAGYFGTPEQQQLQARLEEHLQWISTTPGACNSGRYVGCDDIDGFGWSRIEEIINRDGAIGFRLLPKERATEVADWIRARGFRIDFWDPFIGKQADVIAETRDILNTPLPARLMIGPRPVAASGPYIEAIQRLMADSGVAPYSGSILVGSVEPAMTVTILDGTKNVVAAAFGQKPHNSLSRFHNYAYGGAVVVASSHRGLGLGRYVNALVASRVLIELGGTHFYEFVSDDNEPSRRMVMACGLRQSQTLTAAMAVKGDRKFTR